MLEDKIDKNEIVKNVCETGNERSTATSESDISNTLKRRTPQNKRSKTSLATNTNNAWAEFRSKQPGTDVKFTWFLSATSLNNDNP